MFSQRIARPAVCPACGGEVWVPVLKAYRYSGSRRERAGDVCDCAACACRVTLLREGGLVRFGGARPPLAAPDAGGPTGGHGTGRPGGLDPDMVTFDTQLGPL